MNKDWQVGSAWALLLAGLGAVTLAQPGQLWAPVGLTAVGVAAGWLNWGRSKRLLPRNSLVAPWLLFCAGATLAAGYSFAQAQATLQLMRILTAFALFCVLAEASNRELRIAAWVSLMGAGAAGLLWTVTHDFTVQVEKFALINQAGRAINALFWSAPRWNVSGNVIGGVLAMAAPLGAGLVYLAWREQRRGELILAGLMTLLVLGGLLMTSSRGAMLGLVAACGLGLMAWAQRRWLPLNPGKALFWSAVGLAAALALLGLSLSGNLERLAGAVPDPTGSLQSRVEIWRQGFVLTQDYVFTGAGLGTFPLVYSIYRLLIHVPFHEHMHNIFLETWFEQGVLGVLAMLWGMGVVAGWAWRALSATTASDADSRRRTLGWAGVVALTAMGVHGLMDVVFYLKPTMPLVGLAAGFAAQLAPARDERATSTGSVFWRRAALVGGLTAIGLGLIFYRPLFALGYANLGALYQTRAEMTAYNPDRFDNPTLDRVRREADLAPAIGYFEMALAYQPGIRTALERLAEIELSRGEYPQALEAMRAAWSAGDRDEVARLLLSDAWLANGLSEKAVELLEGIPQAEGRVWFQAWYRYWLGEDYRRAMDAWRAALLLDPGSEDALYWIEQAREKVR